MGTVGAQIGTLIVVAGAVVGHAAEPASTRAVRYAPPPLWVIAPPADTAAPTPPGAPVRLIYADHQLRITGKGQEEYQASRLKLLTPEALGAGNIGISWSPASEEMVVHRLAIVRDGRTIDVLATQKFAIIQRENNLEQSMLDGDLTATLQAAGLQVGDEIEFAATKIRRQTSLGERPGGFMQFPVVGVRGAYRFRLLAPQNDTVALSQSSDLPQPVTRTIGAETERQFLLADPASATTPDEAPPRYSVTRLVQFSGYRDWASVSRTFHVAFAAAGALSPGSSVRAEAARIAAATPDPAKRVEAALRLVQDQVRYVYVGLDGGNYRPAGVEETWQRRFGDCKAKTVLLIALLREMGIAAEPVLVASKGGDGTDQRLPTPQVFDHVVVRATVNGAPVWLDGTRTGDRALAGVEPPASRWALPLRAAGAALEPIAPVAPRLPGLVQLVEIDASAGFDKPGRYRVQQTLRGDEIFGLRAQLAGVAPADADKMLAAYWRQQMSGVEPSRTTWRFNDVNRLLVLGMEGEGKVDWELEDRAHTHYLFSGGFSPPAEMKRPKDQSQDAAWATDFPAFTCYATTVKLPPTGKGLRWTFSSKPVDRVLGGVAYWRIASFDGSVARLVKSRRVLTPEISAMEVARFNAAIDGFDNNKAYVWETPGKASVLMPASADAVFGTPEAFAGPTPPCQGKAGPKTP